MEHSGSFVEDFTQNGQINMIEGGQFTSSNPNVDLSDPAMSKPDRFRNIADGETVTITYTVDLGGSCGVQDYSNDYVVASCAINVNAINFDGSKVTVDYQTVCPISTNILAIATSLTTGQSYTVNIQDGDVLQFTGLPQGDQYELDLEVGNNTQNRCTAASQTFNT